jgi:hypothetical protein
VGGGLAILGGPLFPNSAIKATVKGSAFQNNQAVGGGGGTTGVGGNGYGGGIYVGSGPVLALLESTITGNDAAGSDAVYQDGQGVGGGVYLAGSGSTVDSATVITANYASDSDDDLHGSFN